MGGKGSSHEDGWAKTSVDLDVEVKAGAVSGV